MLCVATLALAGCSSQFPLSEPDAHSAGRPEQPGRDEHAAEAHKAADEHAGEAEGVRLAPEQLEAFGVEIAAAAPGIIARTVTRPGEVTYNPDRIVHVTPRAPGYVQSVHATLGDLVSAGDVLAVIASRDLAKAKSAYLAAVARLEIATANFEREERLWKQEIGVEADYLAARQALAESSIARRLAERELHALGLSDADIAALPEQDETALTRHDLVSPLTGMVMRRHLTQGEVVDAAPDNPPFVVADLSSVWVRITVYHKDLGAIRAGQSARIFFGPGIPDATGHVDYVSPVVEEATRTATARVVLPNPDGHYRPGLFATAEVAVGKASVDVRIPRSALITFEGENAVFIEDEHGFEPRVVQLGRANDMHVEVVQGLQPGDRYVSAGAFTVKAEMLKGAFGGHGHAH